MKKLILITAVLLFAGAGCALQLPVASQPDEKKLVEESPAAEVVNTWVHPKFGFKFQIPTGILAQMNANGNDVVFVAASKKSVEYARMVVQPGIPGIPLADNKVEKIKVDGVAGHLYHDIDQADGGDVDKLIVDFPNGKNTVYIASADLPEAPMWDLKSLAASWKWKK